jgi:hypothetical protein
VPVQPAKPSGKRPAGNPAWLGLSALALVSCCIWLGTRFSGRGSTGSSADVESATWVTNLTALQALEPAMLAQADIGRMNLLCAHGLPGAEDLDLERSLSVLDAMTDRVRVETQRHFYRFQRNPAEFENSEGFFRMLMLAVVLAEDFGVQYAPGKMGTTATARADDDLFAVST